MAKTSKPKSALPYLRQLLEDEYVQEQLGEAAIGLRSAYRRAAKQRARAADDKMLYGSLRRAATSIRNAGMALRKPEPPPQRRGRKILIIGLAAGGAALLTRLGRHQPNPATSSNLDAAHAAATPPPQTGPRTQKQPWLAPESLVRLLGRSITRKQREMRVTAEPTTNRAGDEPGDDLEAEPEMSFPAVAVPGNTGPQPPDSAAESPGEIEAGGVAPGEAIPSTTAPQPPDITSDPDVGGNAGVVAASAAAPGTPAPQPFNDPSVDPESVAELETEAPD